MVDERHRKLHEHVAGKAGDAYRVGFYYDADEWEVVHVREDLATRRLHEELPDIRERVTDTRALVREEDYPPLGEARATTEVHENGVIVHFPEDGTRGTVVSLDRRVARNLTEFVVECTSILDVGGETRWRADGRPASEMRGTGTD
ncbi:hypothetical protein GCM10009037_21270 [Halarchaeum grantii]|uniref:Uncharacterized protein n=1 Tax=Halarchaeum grantii TaxID=1193105 RepID=A0A830F450_9EURY|nr:hypothetical protein [Halarchaeum grantii]GGL37479.1 hypothetical protein GCM10009037_21270 [Halarchaeum grantii]